MRIAVILGTRPEIIRLYHIVKQLPNKTIYWTGQNFEKNLSDDIFEDIWLKDAYKNIIKLSTHNETNFVIQFSTMITSLAECLTKKRPDKVLILGDTNSSLAGALVSKKLGIPLFHLEAGNRCYDPYSPEEINRKLIDSITDVHLCYTHYAKQNLISEGVPRNQIHVVGNPIAEFSELHEINNEKKHILVTCHRQENYKHLDSICKALEQLGLENKVIACIHPRYIEVFNNIPNVTCIPSVPFSHFIKLQKQAKVIITDSGTVCEEAAMLQKPCVIIRKTMERPELFDYGTCILSGVEQAEHIFNAVNSQLNNQFKWELPSEYRYSKVSLKVKNILLGKGNYI